MKNTLGWALIGSNLAAKLTCMHVEYSRAHRLQCSIAPQPWIARFSSPVKASPPFTTTTCTELPTRASSYRVNSTTIFLHYQLSCLVCQCLHENVSGRRRTFLCAQLTYPALPRRPIHHRRRHAKSVENRHCQISRMQTEHPPTSYPLLRRLVRSRLRSE